MRQINLMFVPTLALALALFALGRWVGSRVKPGRRVVVWSVVAAAAAIPAVLFAGYYTHLLDRWAWFYAFRAAPGSELWASGLGFGAGLIAGLVRRSAVRRNSLAFPRIVSGILVCCVVLVLFAPYAKPVIAPIPNALVDRWSNGVCLQSSPSTCGPASAATLLRRFGRSASEAELARECFTYGSGTENWYLARALQRRGLVTHYVVSRPPPGMVPYPSIAGTGVGGAGHFITILDQRQEDGRYLVGDPISGRLLMTPSELRSRFHLTGFFLVVGDPRRSGTSPPAADIRALEDLYGLHGATHIHHYYSRTLRETRRLHVYTPPGYDPKRGPAYPVLYLLHGSPGDDANWTAYGQLNATMDRLITTRQCPPFVVVMPNSEVPGALHGRRRFEQELFRDVMPFVEGAYRVRRDAEGRALAGLSMGGFNALAIGLNHLDTFAWIGVFSAGLREGFVTEGDLAGPGQDAVGSAARLRLLYVRIGKRDFFLHDARRLHRWLERHSIPNVYREVDGTHEWPVWQGALADFAPRLFTNRAERSLPPRTSGSASRP